MDRLRRAGKSVTLQLVCAVTLLPLGIYNFLLGRVWLQLHANDFGKFYYAVEQWLHGVSLYAPNAATRMTTGNGEREFLNMNPPHFHLAVLPLAALPLRAAAIVWLASNIAAAALAVRWVLQELDWNLRPRHVLPTAALILLCAGTGAMILTGQFTGLLLLPVVTAWRAARRGQWTKCGAWLGVVISIKPFLGLFIPYLIIRREWRALVAAALVAVGAFSIGLSVFGVSSHSEWLRAMSVVDWGAQPMNGALYGLFARSLAPSLIFTPVQHAPWLVKPLWAVAAAIVAAVTLVGSRRSIDHGFATVILAAVLICPLGWVYYVWLAAPACAAIWQTRRPMAVWLGAFGLAVPLVAVMAWQPSALATVTLGSAYLWGTLGFWFAALERRPVVSPLGHTARCRQTAGVG